MILIVSLTFSFYISFSIMLISVVGIYCSYWPSVISVLVRNVFSNPRCHLITCGIPLDYHVTDCL